MKKTILHLIICMPLFAVAQQTAQYSLWALNPFATNSAYAGLDNSLVATGVYRKQWNGFDGGPVTQQVNAHLPIYALQSGVGFLVENESLGAHRRTSGQLAWNFRKSVGADDVLSVGVSSGFSQILLDGSLIRTPGGDYADPATSTHNDPILSFNKESAFAPSFGAGVFYLSKKIEIGVSAEQITQSKWSFSQNLTLKSRRTMSASVGRIFDISENLKLKPTVLVKTDLAETQVDAAILARFRENIVGGLSFRGFSAKSRDAFVFFAGTKLNDKTMLAYAYDLTLSRVGEVSRGSHEVMLQYNLGRELGKGRLPAIIQNPRFQ
jgi:type IX secretion system PorP/SprF family membrane protein